MKNPRALYANQKGVTLIEILVVVGMIAILGAISYPAFQSFSGTYNFRAAAREVMTTAMQARSNAIRDNDSWRLEFDNAANSFNLVGPDGSSVAHNLSSYGHGIKLIGDSDSTCGSANKNWNNDAISQTTLISFTGRGFGNSRSSYLEDINNSICFAVSVSSSGVIRTHRYNGSWD